MLKWRNISTRHLYLYTNALTALVFCFFLSLTGFAQGSADGNFPHVHDEKCGAAFMEQLQEKELGVFGSKEYFETWLSKRKQELKDTESSQRRQEEVRKIPVVVHVIHTGTPVGVGANIPDSQVLSQIAILNQDFRRLNPDAENTPEEFQAVAGDAGVEFVLARQDPSGMPTNGINRVQGSRDTYPLGFNAQISELAYWPAEDYLNFWVLPLQSPNIGYASFPVASNLPGLDFPPPSRLTDGVTIDYRYFGEGGNALPSSRGRTATHEVGHFLGLRHIWGDGGCGIDDFVADTPEQGFFTAGCPPHPRSSCGSVDMFQNFMDYTSDVCMNLFTLGQIERMNTVLAFSPRRTSLLTSRALEEPELLLNNLRLDKIIDPFRFVCGEEIIPSILISNVGGNRVASAEVQIRLNDDVVQTRTFALDLPVGGRDTLRFELISLNPTVNNFFEAEILSVNGELDEDPFNNYLNSSPIFASFTSLPFYQASQGIENWDILNPDNLVTWQPIDLVLDGVIEELMYLNGYNYNLQGEVDYLISPTFSLRDVSNAQLSFDMAFAPFDSEQFQEGLMVAVSLDCGNTFQAMDYLYTKRDDSLATESRTFNEFFPNSQAQFRKEVVNLSAYAGHERVRVALISSNGFGNNIFVKNLTIEDSEVYRYDFSLSQKNSPLPVTAGLQERDEVIVENTGNLPIDGFLVDIFMQGRASDITTLLIRDFGLGVGESKSLELPDFFRFGQNRIDYRIYQPNFDQNGGNSSTLRWHIFQDSSAMDIPWRQDFDRSEALGSWLRINPERNFSSWRVFLGNGENTFLGLTTMQEGDSYWFASPLFDLSGTDRASLFFGWTGGGFSNASQLAFEVLVSNDGGATAIPLWSREGAALNNTSEGQRPSEANPGTFQREFINLSDFAGQDNIRVFFRVSDHGAPGASLFLDDLELFLSDNPRPVDPGLNNTILYPNPATERFYLAFNFADFESVRIQVISPLGQVVLDQEKPQTLNQTYSFDTVKFAKGLYIVQISSQFFTETRKLIIR
ncbi:MAG: T9SS type A sorting domain-containing protein [Lunatimonas sp.]|uniref:M43 family zinc metalloprotease n=1 Tax=Lunatimonas sp. TaxID=2060141 RepID=UPI00263B620E|nr:M43 family zinc metalloprotease [Lunatimonas sp.]MCC5936896.1 T9SS type A sorting domain-containing protein [Lunatimonas sp.]